MLKKKNIFLFIILILVLTYFSLIEVGLCSKTKNYLQIKIEKKLHKGMHKNKVKKVLENMKINYNITKMGKMEIYLSKNKYINIMFDKNDNYIGTCLLNMKPYYLYLYKKIK